MTNFDFHHHAWKPFAPEAGNPILELDFETRTVRNENVAAVPFEPSWEASDTMSWRS